jgi:hypothetical protein
MSLAHISLMELSVVVHILTFCGITLYQIQATEVREHMRFQQDSAPTHFTVTVPEFVNEASPGRWIGHGSATTPSPLPWPPRSPDLITADNSLWGIIEESGCATL